MRSVTIGLALGALLAATGPANAAWYAAKSKHFVIYADDRPKAVTDFASRLERFDRAARALLKMDDPPVGDGNRVTVYVMPKVTDVQKLIGDPMIGGFYTGRVSGSLAYVAKSDDLGSEPVLYHEYSHHLMMQQLESPYPEWFVEGFAEFLSTPKFEKNGSIVLGAPPQDRGWGLFYGKQLALDALLGESYGEITKLPEELRESVYGRGWLLTHFLTMDPKRAGQLSRYIRAIGAGTPPLQSAQQAFGDFKQLERELNDYLHRSTVMSFRVSTSDAPPPVEVVPLTEGGAAVVVLRGRIKYGLKDADAKQALEQVRAIAARYPGDVLVETTLAEAELDGGNAAAADAAADRAVKADSRNTEALVLKGRAMVARAETLSDPARHDLFEKARDTFIAANKLDTEDPEPLMEFYKAFLAEGVQPNANALAALHYASDLAPQDLGMRLNSAIAYLVEGKLKEARVTLIPVAYSPHAGQAAAIATRMMSKIDAGDAKGALAAASR